MSMISDLVERLRTEAKSMGTYGTDYMATLLTRSADTIEMLSEKAREPKRGEWIDEADKYDASFGIHDYRCSNCNSYADEYIGGHEWYTASKPNFCPYCGADMRSRGNEDN